MSPQTNCNKYLHMLPFQTTYLQNNRILPHNYDFTNYIVSWTLPSQNRTVHSEKEYICKTCHNNLITKDNHLPCMPCKTIAHKKSVPGYEFLQAIHEKPEFVCTCCLKWMLYNLTLITMISQTTSSHGHCHHKTGLYTVQRNTYVKLATIT